MITVHSDVVGSLLRPPELRHARNDVEAGRITQAEFKSIEDRAVDEAIQFVVSCGVVVPPQQRVDRPLEVRPAIKLPPSALPGSSGKPSDPPTAQT